MFNALVSVIDKKLRARDGIFEYSNCPRCIFRGELATNDHDVALSDGTRVPAGNHLIQLHLWNERITRFPAAGPTLGWARRICRDFEISLEELAAFLADNRELDQIAAVAANVVFGSSEQTQSIAQMATRFGFLRAVDAAVSPSLGQRLHRLGENILVSMLVMSHNPAAFRVDIFRRDRVALYLHRSELMSRFSSRRGAHPG